MNSCPDQRVTVPKEADGCRHVYHLYVILIDGRDDLQKYLNDKGVGTGLHYPVPLHLQKAYAYRGTRRRFSGDGERGETPPVSAYVPELTKAQIEYVANCIKECMNKSDSLTPAPFVRWRPRAGENLLDRDRHRWTRISAPLGFQASNSSLDRTNEINKCQ